MSFREKTKVVSHLLAAGLLSAVTALAVGASIGTYGAHVQIKKTENLASANNTKETLTDTALAEVEPTVVAEVVEPTTVAEVVEPTTVAEVVEPTAIADPSEPILEPITDEVSAADSTVLITSTAFGEAEVCSTRAELQQALPNMTVSEFDQGPLVDTAGVKVTDADGNLAFYALTFAGAAADDELFFFYTDNPDYVTAEGIGAGSRLEEAERTYGFASLAYHTQAESREFVTFEEGPKNIDFRTDSISGTAGIYPPGTREYNQTDEYRAGATIQSVVLQDRDCFE